MATADQLTQQIQSTIANQGKDRLDRYNQLHTELGAGDMSKSIQSARQNILDTENLLTSLPTDVRRRTAGRLMNQGQQNRLLAYEREPITQQLQRTSGNLAVGQQGYGDIIDEIDRRLGLEDTTREQGLNELYQQRSNIWNMDSANAQRAYESGQNALNRASQTNYLDMINEINKILNPAASRSNEGRTSRNSTTTTAKKQGGSWLQSLGNSAVDFVAPNLRSGITNTTNSLLNNFNNMIKTAQKYAK